MKRTKMAARIATSAWLLTGMALALAAPATAPTASLWSRLWRTPDQRGQALLQKGDAAGAAQTFVDPQHKGHAALQAHDYTGAAKTLAGIDTTEAHYNRGNALAHTGDLQGAIDAYDAALKHNPQHTDARHNRDVVAAALKKQKENNKDSNKQDPQDKKDKDGSKPNEKEGKPDTQSGDGKDSKDRKDEKSTYKPSDKQGDQQKSKPNDAPGQKPADKPGQAAAPAAPASSPKDDAAQAQRDAQAALDKGAPPPASPQNGASAKQPLTEKQIAQEQWLRAIPDDPGGLLRRKFLIEHMLRQQGQKP